MPEWAFASCEPMDRAAPPRVEDQGGEGSSPSDALNGGLNPRRTFNTPVREAWNAPIHNMLKAIDNHMSLYFKDGNEWHLEKADALRRYLHELKSWIHEQEGK
jgi:hypothetical protein